MYNLSVCTSCGMIVGRLFLNSYQSYTFDSNLLIFRQTLDFFFFFFATIRISIGMLSYSFFQALILMKRKKICKNVLVTKSF